MATVEYLSPGVYGVEVAPTRAEEGISPAKMGIIGWTDRGPVNTPIEVRSVNEFTSFFGPINSLGLTAISMRAFFGTGGQRAWVVRLVPSDALEATVDIDSVPGPTKWTFDANGAGTWGNDLVIQIEGNRNFLDRTAGAQTWTKYNLKVLQPSDFDPTILTAAETYEAVQFNDSLASDYIVAAMTDPRSPSLLVNIITGAAGAPSGLDAAQITDEVIGAGDLLGTVRFTGTLGSIPVLDSTIRIVAADTTIDDEDQTGVPDFTGAIDSANTSYTWTMPTAPILDGSARYFYAKWPTIISETPAIGGLINGANQDFTIAVGAMSAPVHKENTVFQVRYADGAAPPPPSPYTAPAPGGVPYDLATAGPNGPLLPLPVLPIHPGTVLITDSGATPIVDDLGGAATPTFVAPTIGTLFDITGPPTPVGEIDYTTGVITGLGGGPVALTIVPPPAGPVTVQPLVSFLITKAATAGGDNMEQGTALVGAIDGAGTNTIDHVDSLTTPTQNGLVDFRTTTPPASGTTIFVDFVQLGIIESDVAGNLTGDVGIGTNLVDFTTGAVDVEMSSAPLTGTTIDADYQTGQVATDNGLGFFVGDVDASGNNTIDYETGAFDITWDSAPPNATSILANYTQLPRVVQFPLAGGTDGTAIVRADISDPTLEDAREGIYAFDDVEDPLNLVVPDFEGSLFVQADVVDYCEARNTRFYVMGFANGTTKDEAIKYVLVDQAFDTKVAAIYWPNVYFVNELTERPELIPVTPFIAGVYAKTAFNKNVGKSPGGIDDGALDANGTVGPEFGDLINDIRVRDDLYQSRINPLFNSDATGFVVWGVRSLSTEFRWRYVNARLLHNFLMDAINRQLQWAVFENNGPTLWLKIETALKGFMGSLYRQGYFAGVTEQQAFFVVCNATNNSQATIDEGKVLIDIGFSPFKPAEFVIFRLSQPASTITV